MRTSEPIDGYKTQAQRDEEHRLHDPDLEYRMAYRNLCASIETLLNTFQYRVLNSTTLAQMNYKIADVFYHLRATRQTTLIAEGLNVIGGRMFLVPDDHSVVQIRWESAFFPLQRYVQSFANTIPLGHYENFELYLAYQVGLYPTLLARFGDKTAEYASLNVALLEGILHTTAPHFVEAYRRAKLLNLDLTKIL